MEKRKSKNSSQIKSALYGIEDIKEITKRQVSVLYFFASWSRHCKKISPLIREIASNLSESVSVAKIDIDHQHEIANSYNITSVPSVLIFSEGSLISQYSYANFSKSETIRTIKRLNKK